MKPNVTPSDFDLLDLIALHDADAMRILCDRWRAYALTVAGHHLHNHADAEEVVQTAFVQVWRCAARFRRTASFKTWLNRIVVNQSLNRYGYYSRRRMRDHWSLDAPPEQAEGTQELADCSTDFRDELEVEEKEGRIAKALTLLPPAQRELITMVGIQDVSYADVAQRLGLTVGTVKSRLNRARRLLMTQLELIDAPTVAA